MSKVEIYTKAFCPYCTRAMRLLGEKPVEIEEHDITLGGPRQAEMIARSGGRTTVPQIFVNGQHVGGSDDLMALEARGELDPMIAAR
ncbi:glutaredoxin 3 [Sphingomonas sp.]|uniref:glutaredoxin 3 n=1 Tax=Sphingomonas sp. TaxID=28214 RepID=UPI001D7EDDAA|nr:glutaredoxin 3 [Sphingomonas sp.]MBX9796438.1 glutaredoxin 3 [Sphingomonas sp.]